MSYRYLGDADGLTEHDVESAAADYGVKIINYREVEIARLLGSGVARENYDENGRLMEEYREKDYYKNFISVSGFFKAAYATLVLIFIFVSVICLVSAGVIGYTRSITVAVKSKRALMDVKKLGAGQGYLNRILKEQVKKVFVLPTAAVTILMSAYYTMNLWQNDGVISGNEYLVIGFNTAICLMVAFYQYMLYRLSFRKSQIIIFGAGTAVKQ